MIFWLGTHTPGWIGRTDVPLFVSAARLRGRKKPIKSAGSWALDSGGFSEIKKWGRWTVGAGQYAEEALEWSAFGGMAWAATQDWMCEPFMLDRTGLTLREHQLRSVQSYLDLAALAPQIPWVPVLQGWAVEDYHKNCEDYAEAGVNLLSLPLVGLGSVCRRQGTREAGVIVRSLYARGLQLHGFGMKTLGLVCREKLARYLTSSDSMAWSSAARNDWFHDKKKTLPDCTHSGSCANCIRWALAYRGRIAARIEMATAGGTQKVFW